MKILFFIEIVFDILYVLLCDWVTSSSVLQWPSANPHFEFWSFETSFLLVETGRLLDIESNGRHLRRKARAIKRTRRSFENACVLKLHNIRSKRNEFQTVPDKYVPSTGYLHLPVESFVLAKSLMKRPLVCDMLAAVFRAVGGNRADMIHGNLPPIDCALVIFELVRACMRACMCSLGRPF